MQSAGNHSPFQPRVLVWYAYNLMSSVYRSICTGTFLHFVVSTMCLLFGNPFKNVSFLQYNKCKLNVLEDFQTLRKIHLIHLSRNTPVLDEGARAI